MALVTGPKVGSSAKSVTGESSMRKAGEKLLLKTPFRMSQMIGRGIGAKIIPAIVTLDYKGWINKDAANEATPDAGNHLFSQGYGTPQTNYANTPRLDGHPIITAGNTVNTLLVSFGIGFPKSYFNANKLPSDRFSVFIEEFNETLKLNHIPAMPSNRVVASYCMSVDGGYVEEDWIRIADKMKKVNSLTMRITKWSF